VKETEMVRWFIDTNTQLKVISD